jgi:hypothetical protein
MEETKKCSMCNEEKPVELFYKRRGKPVAACKTCLRAKSNQRYAIDQDYRAGKANNEKSRKSWGSRAANYFDIKPHES